MVLDQGFLGDSIHLMPSVFRIRKCLPDCELHVMVEKRVVGLMELFPWVDKVWGYQRHPHSEPLWKQPQHIQQMRKEKFDAVINLNGSQRSSWLTWASGAKLRLGREPKRKKFLWSNCFTHTIFEPFKGHIAKQRYQVLDQAGFPPQEFLYGATIPEYLVQKVKQKLEGIDKFVHISPFTTQDKKELNESILVELLNGLHQQNKLKIVLSCSRDDREMKKMDSLLNKLNFKPSEVFNGNLSMLEFAALISLAKVHVGGDSGSIHIAAMLNIPIVCWFRDYEGVEEWAPSGKRDRVFIGKETEQGLENIRSDDLLSVFKGWF